MQISVSDENDNVPRFLQNSYDFRVKEDSKLGQYVGQVEAQDDDVDKETNALITYSFVPDASQSNPFVVKAETGWYFLAFTRFWPSL